MKDQVGEPPPEMKSSRKNKRLVLKTRLKKSFKVFTSKAKTVITACFSITASFLEEEQVVAQKFVEDYVALKYPPYQETNSLETLGIIRALINYGKIVSEDPGRHVAADATLHYADAVEEVVEEVAAKSGLEGVGCFQIAVEGLKNTLEDTNDIKIYVRAAIKGDVSDFKTQADVIGAAGSAADGIIEEEASENCDRVRIEAPRPRAEKHKNAINLAEVMQNRQEFRASFGSPVDGLQRAVAESSEDRGAGDRSGASSFDVVGWNAKYSSGQFCERVVQTFNTKLPDGRNIMGGYSSFMVTDEKFCVKVPKNLPMDAAAPLLCAGITVYSLMHHFGMNQKGKSFGVVGLGGLGHMAVKFGKAFGMRVTVISTSISKEKEARELLGADDFLVSKDDNQMKKYAKSLDYIIDTVSETHTLEPLLNLLKFDGKLVIVGVPEHPLELPAGAVVFGRKMVADSFIGSIEKATKEQLQKQVGKATEALAERSQYPRNHAIDEKAFRICLKPVEAQKPSLKQPMTKQDAKQMELSPLAKRRQKEDIRDVLDLFGDDPEILHALIQDNGAAALMDEILFTEPTILTADLTDRDALCIAPKMKLGAEEFVCPTARNDTPSKARTEIGSMPREKFMPFLPVVINRKDGEKAVLGAVAKPYLQQMQKANITQASPMPKKDVKISKRENILVRVTNTGKAVGEEKQPAYTKKVCSSNKNNTRDNTAYKFPLGYYEEKILELPLGNSIHDEGPCLLGKIL